MSQVVAFANNQVMISIATPVVITTDPMPLSGADRATMVTNVHYIFGGAPQLTVMSQVSNDGTEWLAAGPSDVLTTPTSNRVGGAAAAAFIRFEFEFTSGGGTGAVCFDCHVLLDHA